MKDATAVSFPVKIGLVVIVPWGVFDCGTPERLCVPPSLLAWLTPVCCVTGVFALGSNCPLILANETKS